MHVTLERFAYMPGGTLGYIAELGIYILERPWLDNEVNVSCIPEGTYAIAPDKEGRWEGYPELQDVPGRTEIIVHPANYVRQIQGCLAPGLGFVFENAVPAATSSQDALYKFRDAGVTSMTITHKEAVLDGDSE